jgi:hypothetical protein
MLQAFPTMPAPVIAERIGWTRSMGRPALLSAGRD